MLFITLSLNEAEMKLLRVVTITFAVTLLFLQLSAVDGAAQSDSKTKDQPALVSAVGPTYPNIASFLNARGEVIVEVKIDPQGKVISASTISGNEYLRKSSETAAAKWQFVAAKEGTKERTARLTFAYRPAETDEPGRTQGEVTTVFMPPYRVEVIRHSVIIN